MLDSVSAQDYDKNWVCSFKVYIPGLRFLALNICNVLHNNIIIYVHVWAIPTYKIYQFYDIIVYACVT